MPYDYSPSILYCNFPCLCKILLKDNSKRLYQFILIKSNVAILAVLLKQIAEERNNKENSIQLNIKLYSVGVENSQDIKFSKEIANELNLPLKTVIIDENTVKESIKPVLMED